MEPASAEIRRHHDRRYVLLRYDPGSVRALADGLGDPTAVHFWIDEETDHLSRVDITIRDTDSGTEFRVEHLFGAYDGALDLGPGHPFLASPGCGVEHGERGDGDEIDRSDLLGA